jgi:hypothetical protein
LEEFMSEKRTKLKPKEIRFLESYARLKDPADAYVAAGYKVKSREVARTCGSRLLRRLDATIDYREIMDRVGLTDRRLAEAMKELIEDPDPKVRVQALNIATKVKGWQRESLDLNPGAEIIIVHTRPDFLPGQTDAGNRQEIQVAKPIALLK